MFNKTHIRFFAQVVVRGSSKYLLISLMFSKSVGIVFVILYPYMLISSSLYPLNNIKSLCHVLKIIKVFFYKSLQWIVVYHFKFVILK